jgi:long-subunit acyl-CoA synthetase (AMP-forming)
MSLIRHLRPFFERYEHRVFLRPIGGKMMKYGEVWKDAETRANMMRAVDRRGSVMVIRPNSKEWVMDVLAALMANRTVVPMSFRSPRTTVFKRLDEFKPIFVSSGSGLIPTDFKSTALSSGGPQEDDEKEARIILLTSGSSGGGSAIELKQSNIVANLEQIHRAVPHTMIGTDDESFAILPWSHCYGMTCELFFLATRGASLHLPRMESIPYDLYRARPTLMFAVPSLVEKVVRMVPQIASVFGNTLLGGRLKAVSVGGARSDPTTLQSFEERFGVQIFEGYGMTECSPMIALNTSLAKRMASVGRVLPGIQVRIDAQTGEILVRGNNVAQSLSSHRYIILDRLRYLKTGDRGYMDEDGFLYIQDRISDHFKLVNGIFIYPQRIEDVFRAHRPIGVSHWVAVPDAERSSIVLVGFMTSDHQSFPALTKDDIERIAKESGLVGREVPANVLYLTAKESANFLTEKQTPRRGLLISFIHDRMRSKLP